jgi:hypothetical protein
VRCCRPPKQCVWLGTGGHCRRGWDTIANADTESYAKSDGYACCLWAVSNTNAYSHSNANGHSYGDCYSNAYCHSYPYTDPDIHPRQVYADTETSSNTAAATIEIFAVANISSYPPPRN